MFKRILKIFSIVLASFVGICGVAVGIMAIRGDFSHRTIKPSALYFVNDEGDKISSQYYTDEQDEESNLYFIIGANPDKVNALEVDVIINDGSELIGFKDETGKLQTTTVAKIGQKTPFSLINIDGLTYEDGIVKIQARANENTISSEEFTIYIDREVKGLTIRDTIDINNNNLVIDDDGQLVSVVNGEKLYEENQQIEDSNTSNVVVTGAFDYLPIAGTVKIEQSMASGAVWTITDTSTSAGSLSYANKTDTLYISATEINYVNGTFTFTIHGTTQNSVIQNGTPQIENPIVRYQHNGIQAEDAQPPQTPPTPKNRTINLLKGQEYDLSAIFLPEYSRKPLSNKAAKGVEYFIEKENDKQYGDFKNSEKTTLIAKDIGKFTVTVGTYATYKEWEVVAEEELQDSEKLAVMVNSKIEFNVTSINVKTMSISSGNMSTKLFEEKTLVLNSTLSAVNASFNLGMDLYDEQNNRALAKFNDVKFVSSEGQFNTITGLQSEKIRDLPTRVANTGIFMMFVKRSEDANNNVIYDYVSDKFTISEPTGSGPGRKWTIRPDIHLQNIHLQIICINSDPTLTVETLSIPYDIGIVPGNPVMDIGTEDKLMLKVEEAGTDTINLSDYTTIEDDVTYKSILYFVHPDGSKRPLSVFENVTYGTDMLLGYLDYDAYGQLKLITNVAMPNKDLSAGWADVYAVTIRTDSAGNWYTTPDNKIILYYELDNADPLYNALKALTDVNSELNAAFGYENNLINKFSLQQLQDLADLVNYNITGTEKINMLKFIKNAVVKKQMISDAEQKIDLTGIIASEKSNYIKVEVIFPISSIDITLKSFSTEIIDLELEGDKTTGNVSNGKQYYLREYYTTGRTSTPIVVIKDKGTYTALHYAIEGGNYYLNIYMYDKNGNIIDDQISNYVDFAEYENGRPVLHMLNDDYSCYYFKLDIKQMPPNPDYYFKVAFSYLDFDSNANSNDTRDVFTIVSSAVAEYIIDDYFAVKGTYNKTEGTTTWKLYKSNEEGEVDDDDEGTSISRRSDIFKNIISHSPSYALHYQHSYTLTDGAEYLSLTISDGVYDFEFLKSGTVKLTIACADSSLSTASKQITIHVIPPAVDLEFNYTNNLNKPNLSGKGDYWVVTDSELKLTDYIAYSIGGNTITDQHSCEIEEVVNENKQPQKTEGGVWAVTIKDTNDNTFTLTRNSSFINMDLYVKVKISAPYCEPEYALLCMTNPVKVQRNQTEEKLVVYQKTQYLFAAIVTGINAADPNTFIKLVNNTGVQLTFDTETDAHIEYNVYKDEIKLTDEDKERIFTLDDDTQLLTFSGHFAHVSEYTVEFIYLNATLATYKIEVRENIVASITYDMDNPYSAYSGQKISNLADFVELKQYDIGVYSKSLTYNESKLIEYEGDKTLTFGYSVDGTYNAANYITITDTAATINWLDRTENGYLAIIKVEVMDEKPLSLIYLNVNNPYYITTYQDDADYDGELETIEVMKNYSLQALLDLFDVKIFDESDKDDNGNDNEIKYDADTINLKTYIDFSFKYSDTEIIDRIVSSNVNDIKFIFNSYNTFGGELNWTVLFKYIYNDINSKTSQTTMDVKVMPANYNGFVTKQGEFNGQDYVGVLEMKGENEFPLMAAQNPIFNPKFTVYTINPEKGSIASIINLTTTPNTSVSFAVANNPYMRLKDDTTSLEYIGAQLGNGQLIEITATVTYPDGFTCDYTFNILAKYLETVTAKYPFEIYDDTNDKYSPYFYEDGVYYEPVAINKSINLFSDTNGLNIKRITATKDGADITDNKTLSYEETDHIDGDKFTPTQTNNGTTTTYSLGGKDLFYFTSSGEIKVLSKVLSGYTLTFKVTVDNGVFALYKLYVSDEADDVSYLYNSGYTSDYKTLTATSGSTIFSFSGIKINNVPISSISDYYFIKTETANRYKVFKSSDDVFQYLGVANYQNNSWNITDIATGPIQNSNLDALNTAAINPVSYMGSYSSTVKIFLYNEQRKNYQLIDGLTYTYASDVYQTKILKFAVVVDDGDSKQYVGNYIVHLRPNVTVKVNNINYDIFTNNNNYTYTITTTAVENAENNGFELGTKLTISDIIKLYFGTSDTALTPVITAPELSPETDLISYAAGVITLTKYAAEETQYTFTLKYKLGEEVSDIFTITFNLELKPDEYFVGDYEELNKAFKPADNLGVANYEGGAWNITGIATGAIQNSDLAALNDAEINPSDHLGNYYYFIQTETANRYEVFKFNNASTIDITNFVKTAYLDENDILLEGWQVREFPSGTDGYDNNKNLVSLSPDRSALLVKTVGTETSVRLLIATSFGAERFVWIIIYPDISVMEFKNKGTAEEPNYQGKQDNPITATLKTDSDSIPETIELDETDILVGSYAKLNDFVAFYNYQGTTAYDVAKWRISTDEAGTGYLLSYAAVGSDLYVYFPHMPNDKIITLTIAIIYLDSTGNESLFNYTAQVYVKLPQTYDLQAKYIAKNAIKEYVIAGTDITFAKFFDQLPNTSGLTDTILNLNDYRIFIKPVDDGVESISIADLNVGKNKFLFSVGAGYTNWLSVTATTIQFSGSYSNAILTISNAAGASLPYSFQIYTSVTKTDELDISENDYNDSYCRITQAEINEGFTIINSSAAHGKFTSANVTLPEKNLQIVGIYNSGTAEKFAKEGNTYTYDGFTITISGVKVVIGKEMTITQPQTFYLHFANAMGYLGELKILFVPTIEYTTPGYDEGENQSFERIYGATAAVSMDSRITLKVNNSKITGNISDYYFIQTETANRYKVFKSSDDVFQYLGVANYQNNSWNITDIATGAIQNSDLDTLNTAAINPVGYLGNAYLFEYTTNSNYITINTDTKKFTLAPVDATKYESIWVNVYYTIWDTKTLLARYKYNLQIINHLKIEMPYATNNTLDVYLSSGSLKYLGNAIYDSTLGWSNIDIPNTVLENEWTTFSAANPDPELNNNADYYFIFIPKSNAYKVYKNLATTTFNEFITFNLAQNPDNYWDGESTDQLQLKEGFDKYVFATLRRLDIRSQIGNLQYNIDYTDKETTIKLTNSDITLTSAGILSVSKNLASWETIVVLVRSPGYGETEYYERFVLNIIPTDNIIYNIDRLGGQYSSKDHNIPLAGTDENSDKTFSSLKTYTLLHNHMDNLLNDDSQANITAYKVIVNPNTVDKDLEYIYLTANQNLQFYQQIYTYAEFYGYKEGETHTDITELIKQDADRGNKYTYTIPILHNAVNHHVIAIKIRAENGLVGYHYLFAGSNIEITNNSQDNYFENFANLKSPEYEYKVFKLDFEGIYQLLGVANYQNNSWNITGITKGVVQGDDLGLLNNGEGINPVGYVGTDYYFIQTKKDYGYSKDYYYHLLAIHDNPETGNRSISVAKANTLFAGNQHSDLLFTTTVSDANGFKLLAQNLDFGFDADKNLLSNADLKARFALVYVGYYLDSTNKIYVRYTLSEAGVRENIFVETGLITIPTGAEVVITDIYLKLIANENEEDKMFNNSLQFTFNFVNKDSGYVFKSFDDMLIKPSTQIESKYTVGLSTHLGFATGELDSYSLTTIIGVVQDNIATLSGDDNELLLAFLTSSEYVTIESKTLVDNLTLNRSNNDEEITDKLWKVKYKQTVANSIFNLEKEFYVLCSKNTTFIVAPNLVHTYYISMSPTYSTSGEDKIYNQNTITIDLSHEIKIVDASAGNISGPDADANWYKGKYLKDIEGLSGISFVLTYENGTVWNNFATITDYQFMLNETLLNSWLDEPAPVAYKMINIKVKYSNIYYNILMRVNKPSEL